MSVLFEVSLTPLDKGESVSKYVARSLDIIDKSGLDYRAGSMGTCIEGEWDECLEVIKRCFDDMKQDCHRISVSIKADYRKGKEHCIERKVEHVEKELGHTLKK